MKKIIVFQFRTDQSLTHERECYRNALKTSKVKLSFVNMLKKKAPKIPDISNYSGAIIAGSGQFNVTDWNDFVRSRAEKLYPFMQNCISLNYPLLGVCFGHQLMAHALEGKVKRDPKQAEVGTVKIILTSAGQKDVLYKNIPKKFYVAAGHKDSVTKLPKGGVLLAKSNITKIESYKIKNNIYAVQFHPELDFEALIYRLSLYPEYMKGKSKEEIRSQHHKIPYATEVLKNFLEIVK